MRDLRNQALLICTGALLLLATAAPAAATILLRQSFEELVVGADRIVTGRCVDSRAEWRGSMLFTVATVEVEETWKGAAATTVEVVVLGGVDPERHLAATIAGAPSLDPGEDLLLFLTADPAAPGDFHVTGFSQGEMSLVVGEDGEMAAARDLSQVRLAGPSGVRPGGRDRVPLAELRRRVEDILATYPPVAGAGEVPR